MTIQLPGVERGSSTLVSNYSTATQTPVATTRTYLDGSALAVPVGGLTAGAKLRWKFNMTKTAAGTASSTIDIAFGTTGTTSDTARVSFTKPGGSAAIDEGQVTIEALVKSVSATGVVVGEMVVVHNLASTGHMTIPVATVNAVSSGFDNTSESLIAGICITTGASDAITIDMVSAELVQ